VGQKPEEDTALEGSTVSENVTLLCMGTKRASTVHCGAIMTTMTESLPPSKPTKYGGPCRPTNMRVCRRVEQRGRWIR